MNVTISGNQFDFYLKDLPELQTLSFNGYNFYSADDFELLSININYD